MILHPNDKHPQSQRWSAHGRLIVNGLQLFDYQLIDLSRLFHRDKHLQDCLVVPMMIARINRQHVISKPSDAVSMHKNHKIS